jgi:hypothetical protein
MAGVQDIRLARPRRRLRHPLAAVSAHQSARQDGESFVKMLTEIIGNTKKCAIRARRAAEASLQLVPTFAIAGSRTTRPRSCRRRSSLPTLSSASWRTTRKRLRALARVPRGTLMRTAKRAEGPAARAEAGLRARVQRDAHPRPPVICTHGTGSRANVIITYPGSTDRGWRRAMRRGAAR